MAANYSPVFTRVPVVGSVQVSVANTARDGTGTIATLVTGAADGTRIDLIRMNATVTTTAGMIRLFIDSTGGGTWRLFDEITVSAVTPSGTVAAWEAEYVPTVPISLPSGAKIGVSTNNAQACNVFAFGGDYTAE